jgi:hypothetical protein
MSVYYRNGTLVHEYTRLPTSLDFKLSYFRRYLLQKEQDVKFQNPTFDVDTIAFSRDQIQRVLDGLERSVAIYNELKNEVPFGKLFDMIPYFWTYDKRDKSYPEWWWFNCGRSDLTFYYIKGVSQFLLDISVFRLFELLTKIGSYKNARRKWREIVEKFRGFVSLLTKIDVYLAVQIDPCYTQYSSINIRFGESQYKKLKPMQIENIAKKYYQKQGYDVIFGEVFLGFFILYNKLGYQISDLNLKLIKKLKKGDSQRFQKNSHPSIAKSILLFQ